MKIDMNQRTMIWFNKAKHKTRENKWYESSNFDLIHTWYNSKNHESNQIHMANKGMDNHTLSDGLKG